MLRQVPQCTVLRLQFHRRIRPMAHLEHVMPTALAFQQKIAVLLAAKFLDRTAQAIVLSQQLQCLSGADLRAWQAGAADQGSEWHGNGLSEPWIGKYGRAPVSVGLPAIAVLQPLKYWPTGLECPTDIIAGKPTPTINLVYRTPLLWRIRQPYQLISSAVRPVMVNPACTAQHSPTSYAH